MNSGILPVVLMSLTFGLALSFVPLQASLFGLAAMAVAAVATSFIPFNGIAPELIFLGLWAGIIATAILIYFPFVRSTKWVVPAGLNAGLWTGAYVSISGLRGELPIGLLSALVFVPGQWFANRGYAIVIKVVASWLIAIATLSSLVSLMPTPGYKPDHME